ncbi:hypothetical protein C8R43DRAFT_344663 [Mycena crocata]|nr:hypothetical protein C8R43DRAFT_344663 [Mycena crocata]
MNSYDCRFMTKLALLLIALPVLPVRADRVCVTSDTGAITCENKLSTGTIAALVVTIILLITLLGGIVAFFFYRRRRLAAAKSAIAANAYVIEASQMRGPAAFGSAPVHPTKGSGQPYTTYSATYDPRSAPLGVKGLPTKPGSAKTNSPNTAPTTYGGVTYPFPGYSSPKGSAPRSESAFAGTYTTMSGGIGSTAKV